MVEKHRLKTITTMAWPIILGMISSNVFLVVDRMMIGRLGDSAVAAVGQSGFLFNLTVALLLGLGTAVQAITARYVGQCKLGQEAGPLKVAMLISLMVGLPLAVLGYYILPHIFPMLHPDQDVISQGVSYVRTLLAGSVFLGCAVSFQGFWNGLGKPLYYMKPLLVTQALNIILNYLLIFGKFGFPAMGVSGAALASVLSSVVGVAIHFVLGFRYARDKGFLNAARDRELMNSLLSLSIPFSIQQISFNLGYLVFLTMIGRMGTLETAAASAILTIIFVGIMIPIGLGTASATLVGQALGRGQPEDASRWAWEVARLGLVGMLLLCLPMVFFPELILSLFLTNPETIEMGRVPMILTCIMMGIYSINFVMMHSLLGAGAAKRVMATSMSFQWGVFLPGVYIVGPVLGYGLLEVWIVQLVYGGFLGIAYTWQWHNGYWKKIAI